MDATFGIGLQGLNFFILMYVHPETQISVPLAFFIRKCGSEEDPHPLIPDLRWMEGVLQQRFGFPAPRYIIVDKCAGSLSAQAQLVKADWSSQRPLPAGVSESNFLKDPTLLLSSSQSVLLNIAASCTAEEQRAFSLYIAQTTDASWNCNFPVAVCDISHASAQTARSVFGEWADQHPTLVRALAKHLSALFTSTQHAVELCHESAGAVDGALRELQSFAWAISDSDSVVSTCFRVLVERWIRLCYFHAKKAIREHGACVY